ncbi:MAG: ABC transporter ATP-binding protein [Candidatus Woesearchaeota archaeon]
MSILEVKGVSKRFGGIRALRECSLSVKKGSITALIGPNGSGKSTLFHVISQLEDEDNGSIIVQGHDVSKYRPSNAHLVARHGISRTFQDVRLFPNLTIREHLSIALSTQDESLWRNVFWKRELIDDSIIQKWLSVVGLDKPLDTLASDLSYGQRKLLDLAIAIAKPHVLLMLDEPVAGVNPKLRTEIKNIIRKRVKEGDTILVIEHDMNFVMDLADYVYVLDAGKVIAKGTPKQVQANKKVLAAYLGG